MRWMLLTFALLAPREPFELSAFHCCIYSAPVKVPITARYDPERVVGEVCIIVDGPEFHPSCWNAEELGTPIVRRVFDLHAPGEYLVQMRQVSGNGKRLSNTVVLVLN